MGVANASPSTPARGCQPPVLGPPPAVASHAADGWRGLTVLRPARTPSASRGCACAAPHVVAACCTPTNFCTSFSLHDRAQQGPPQRLQRCQRFCISRFKQRRASHWHPSASSAQQSSPSRPSRAGGLSPAPVLATPGSAGRRPPASAPESAGWRGRARSRGTAARGAGRPWKRPFEFPIL